jgi:hypothetical protein
VSVVERLRALDERAFPRDRWWGKSFLDPANYVTTLRFVIAEILVAAACLTVGITLGLFTLVIIGAAATPWIVRNVVILRRIHRDRPSHGV